MKSDYKKLLKSYARAVNELNWWVEPNELAEHLLRCDIDPGKTFKPRLACSFW